MTKFNVDKQNEPKFKVGDWLQYRNAKPFFVEEVTKQGYVNGNSCLPFNWESEIHLWTIEYAKPGDILVCKGDIKGSNGITCERICLFNNLNSAFFTLTKTSNYVEEYGIDVNIDYPDNTVPATKEQKEILFMAMKEAGYEWNAEKKEIV